MEKNYYGYIRVSSIDQNEERQYIELLRWGIDPCRLYCDKVSGKDFNRPQYQELRKRLQEGDVLVVKSIDRLGRNYQDIQQEWSYIVKEKKADIVIVDMPLLDTRSKRDLIGTLISDIVLQLLSYVAETERIHIRQRQAEGIEAALARGVQFGRSYIPIPDSFPDVYHRWKQKKITPQRAMEESRLTKNQFYWMVHKYKKSLSCHDEIQK